MIYTYVLSNGEVQDLYLLLGTAYGSFGSVCSIPGVLLCGSVHCEKKYHGTGTKAAGAAPTPPHLNVGDLHAVYCAAEMVLFSAALDPHAPSATLRCGGAGAAPSPMPSVSGWLFFSQCTECILSCLAHGSTVGQLLRLFRARRSHAQSSPESMRACPAV